MSNLIYAKRDDILDGEGGKRDCLTLGFLEVVTDFEEGTDLDFALRGKRMWESGRERDEREREIGDERDSEIEKDEGGVKEWSTHPSS